MTKRRHKKQNAAEEAASQSAKKMAAEEVAAEEAAVEETAADAAAADAEPVDEPAADEPAAADPLAELEAQRKDFEERWLRALAEMDNLRKRMRREVDDTRRFAKADVLRAMLEIQDNFERALQSERSLPAAGDASDTDEPDAFRAGVELIFQRLRGVLQDQGAEPIEAQDQPFDPTVHEAVGQLPRDGVEAGVVIEVVQPGFRFDGMVLRPARVIISA
jgi:molecular chaperone GrpE